LSINHSSNSDSDNKTVQLESGGLVSQDYLDHAKSTFLEAQSQDDFLAACGKPLRKSVRINCIKSSVEDFKQWANNYGWSVTPIPWCETGFWIDYDEQSFSMALGNCPEHIQGLFYIQEASSMLPVEALLHQNTIADPLIVDLAAAPGSKTTQLASILDNRGTILANELSASRLKGLHANLVRCGINNTSICHLDAAKFSSFLPEQFDYVLLDAPCGGEGTVRKDINALKDWSLESVNQLAELQKQLIISAYQSLKPGGRMVYSTCTLSPEENQQVAAFLLQQTDAKVVSLKDLFSGAEKSLTNEGYLHVLPHHYDSEGFFVSCFSKPESQSLNNDSTTLKKIYDSPFMPVSQKEYKLVKEFMNQRFSIDMPYKKEQIKQRDNEIWLFPMFNDEINPYIKINRSGIKLFRLYGKKIRITHEFASGLGRLAKQNTYPLTVHGFEEYMQGKAVDCDDKVLAQLKLTDGDILLSFNNSVFACGLLQKNRIKNALPRDMVKDNYQFSSITGTGTAM